MGKHRKTKAQKKLTELRQQKAVQPNDSSAHIPSASLSYTFKATEKTTTAHIYSLTHDLKKTVYVSLGIIIFQALLFLLLHNHALMLPLVSLRY